MIAAKTIIAKTATRPLEAAELISNIPIITGAPALINIKHDDTLQAARKRGIYATRKFQASGVSVQVSAERFA
jgi:hypothetical protein